MVPHVLIVVFDGLRPDMVRPDLTPNLLRLLESGTRFPRARSVFPSETRVCSASLATGVWPRRHGLVANRLIHPREPGRLVDTGQRAQLVGLEQDLGEPLLCTPTLGEFCARTGRDCVVVSSGSTGQAFALNPRADSLGQITLSGHGPEACSARGRALFATLPPPPGAAPERAVWAAEAVRTHLLPEPPALTILWLCEPDTSAHYDGLGSAGNHAALRLMDTAFGRILDDWEAGPRREDTVILVASDHGHATIDGHADIRLPTAAWRMPAGPTSGLIVPPEQVADAAGWLMAQPWVGNVFADAPGALPLAAVLADHVRAAPVVFTWRTGPAGADLPGTSLHAAGGELALGAGTHGGLSPAEMSVLLGMAGPGIAAGTSNAPAALVDIAPTVLSLLGISGAASMDGRSLTSPAPRAETEVLESAAGAYAQSVIRLRQGNHTWLDHGGRAAMGMS